MPSKSSITEKEVKDIYKQQTLRTTVQTIQLKQICISVFSQHTDNQYKQKTQNSRLFHTCVLLTPHLCGANTVQVWSKHHTCVE